MWGAAARGGRPPHSHTSWGESTHDFHAVLRNRARGLRHERDNNEFYLEYATLERAAADYNWPEDVEIVVVHVSVDGSRVKDRVIDRGYERDAWKIEHWDEFWATAQAAEGASADDLARVLEGFGLAHSG